MFFIQFCMAEKSVDPESVAKLERSLELVKKLMLPIYLMLMKQFFFFYNLEPNKTLGLQNEKYHRGKRSKLCITVLLAANLDGSEILSSHDIDKLTNPRCFKNLKTLPTKYDTNRKSQMAGILFTNWLKNLDSKKR